VITSSVSVSPIPFNSLVSLHFPRLFLDQVELTKVSRGLSSRFSRSRSRYRHNRRCCPQRCRG
jgi:hypothetical protein